MRSLIDGIPVGGLPFQHQLWRRWAFWLLLVRRAKAVSSAMPNANKQMRSHLDMKDDRFHR